MRDQRKIVAMSTATKIAKTVETALAEWERLKLRARGIEQTRDEELQAQRAKFDKACEPINAAARTKLDPLYEKLRTFEATIERELKLGISADGETVAVAQVDVGGAVAEVKDSGSRQIAPEEFLKAVPAADRNPDFYNCLNVLIGKAEKFLPEAVMKKLAKLNHKHSVVVRLKR